MRGLDHVQVAIPEGGEARAREFYAGLLGLSEVAKPAALAARGGCWFVGEGLHLHLGVDASFRAAAKAHLGVVVADLDQARAELAGAGVPVIDDDVQIGVGRFYAQDPFGNRIELVAERDRGFTERTAADRG